ncbi:hypothetical protein ABZ753_31000 [Streptomyces griseoincarnatus]
MSADAEAREETCPDCQAGPDNMDVRTFSIGKDPDTGRTTTTVTWHLEDCPSYTVQQILLEDGVRRAEERTEWTRQEFPAAQERLLDLVMRGEFDATAKPFVAALVELVEAQGEDLGRFVTPDRWVEILNKHFPPDEEPTA